jgi:hypothetical protein
VPSGAAQPGSRSSICLSDLSERIGLGIASLQ